MRKMSVFRRGFWLQPQINQQIFFYLQGRMKHGTTQTHHKRTKVNNKSKSFLITDRSTLTFKPLPQFVAPLIPLGIAIVMTVPSIPLRNVTHPLAIALQCSIASRHRHRAEPNVPLHNPPVIRHD